ncbi:hypothetical protein F5887DRAFT_932526 [Amanita rubescens]|nr:hypothetical protein F5887DRAFT_932526 [Amanita rubescens]
MRPCVVSDSMQSSDNAIRTFFCLIEGDNVVFDVQIAANKTIANLKDIIHEKGIIERPIRLAKNPTLLKVDIDLNTRTRHSLSQLAITGKGGDGIQMLDWTSVSENWPIQPADRRLHIFVKISPTTGNSRVLARLRELHTHLWGENRIVHRGEMSCSILDLALFDALNLNIRPDNILLVRNEYVLAYDHILRDTLKNPTMRRWRSATIVTGQPGIGKTLFLFYVLARRLHERSPVAFQIDKHKFALFNQDGVTLHSTTTYSHVPERTWALSDSNVSDRRGLCMAFQQPAFHIIHTSSPSSSRWKNLGKIGASKYIMDVWSLEELQTLLALNNLDFREGKDLFEKYGPSPRIIIDILTKTIKEDTYESEVITAAATLAGDFSYGFLQLESLDFGADISSKIFTVRPKMSRWDRYLEIPTSFLCHIFGLAMSRQEAAQQLAFFRIFNGHPSFRDAGRWLFEDYAHNRLSDSERKPLEAYSLDGTVRHIPVPDKMIVGSTALKHIQPPHNFYWRPVKPNFKGVNAIIRSGDDVWVLQYTMIGEHKALTDGLVEIRDGMNHKRNVKWHLVIIGSYLMNALDARDEQKLGDDWKWTTVQVYASELSLGQFNELHARRLETVLNDAELLECS